LEKIKAKGSLYGVPSTEFNREAMDAMLVQKMAPMIYKPTSFMDNSKIDQKYARYQEKQQII
jgi:hypothetical protein